MRMSALVYDEANVAFKDFLIRLVGDAAIYCNCSRLLDWTPPGSYFSSEFTSAPGRFRPGSFPKLDAATAAGAESADVPGCTILKWRATSDGAVPRPLRLA